METSGVPSCGHLPLGTVVVGKGWVSLASESIWV